MLGKSRTQNEITYKKFETSARPNEKEIHDALDSIFSIDEGNVADSALPNISLDR